MNFRKCVFIIAAGLVPFIYTGTCFAEGGHDHDSRPDFHAPIGIMGDHVHKKNEWMFSYRYMYMDMGENRIGTDDVSDARVLEDFMITPTDMQMQMHMVGAMYAIEDDFTIMAMLPIIRKDMNHINRAGLEFRTNSEGVGDIRLMGLVPLVSNEQRRWHANVGVSLPSGSINEIDDLPTGKGKRLPYPMQLGSGTVDLIPGITYMEQTGDWSWGAQAIGNLRTGRNRVGYSLGDELEVSTWISKLLGESVSVSTRLDYRLWSNIDGQDSSLSPLMVPTADPKSRGGKRIDLVFGINLFEKDGPLAGHRFAIEAGFPIFESLDGPQLSKDWNFTIGWQRSY